MLKIMFEIESLLHHDDIDYGFGDNEPDTQKDVYEPMEMEVEKTND